MSTISDALASAQKAAKLSNATLGRKINLDRGMVSYVGRGLKETSYANVDAWLLACGMRLVCVPVDARVSAKVDAMTPEEQDIVLKVVAVLPHLPADVRAFLEDQLTLWTRRYAEASTEQAPPATGVPPKLVGGRS